MTRTEKERLAVVEEKIDNIEGNVNDIKRLLENLDSRYPTRREVWAIIGAVGLTGTILSVIVTISGFIN